MKPDFAVLEVLRARSVRGRDEQWQLFVGDVLVLLRDEACRLLQEAPDSVRLLGQNTLPTEFPPIYWQHGDRIVGPGTIEDTTIDKHGIAYLLVSWNETVTWVRASQRRSEEAFRQQSGGQDQ